MVAGTKINTGNSEFDAALRHAFKEFKYQHPVWVKSQFDEDFLLTDAAPLWDKYSRQHELPSSIQLARLWSDRLGSASLKFTIKRIMAAKPVAADFLKLLKSELAAPQTAVYIA